MSLSRRYETAFAEWMRQHRHLILDFDESHRNHLDDEWTLKTPDFLVHPPGDHGRWLVDVKGRRFPGGSPSRPSYRWESW